MLRARDLKYTSEPLATLGNLLALYRMSTSAAGFAGRTIDVGAYMNEYIAMVEVDALPVAQIIDEGRRHDVLPRQFGAAVGANVTIIDRNERSFRSAESRTIFGKLATQRTSTMYQRGLSGRDCGS